MRRTILGDTTDTPGIRPVAEWRLARLEVPRNATVPHGVGVDVYTASSSVPGPTVAVLGGVHGDEIAGVLAAGHISGSQIELSRGSLVVVPVCNELAFAASTRTTPSDGRNLARCFPGNLSGSVTERVAALIAEKVLDNADLLIDLHTASRNSDMPLMVGCTNDGGEAADAAVAAARAFAMPTLWLHPNCSPGRTLSVMHDRGRPAIYAEAPGRSGADLDTVRVYVSGVNRVLHHLGMAPPAAPARVDRVVVGAGDLDNDVIKASKQGIFLPAVQPGQLVYDGEIVGRIESLRGTEGSAIVAPTAGCIMYLRKLTRVERGASLACIAHPLPDVRMPSGSVLI
jgi:predicted deacylase